MLKAVSLLLFFLGGFNFLLVSVILVAVIFLKKTCRFCTSCLIGPPVIESDFA